jgi:hypothetical protein
MIGYWPVVVSLACGFRAFVLTALILTLIGLGLPTQAATSSPAVNPDKKEHQRQAGVCRDVVKGLGRGDSAMAAEALGRGAAPENAENRRDKMRNVVRAIVTMSEGAFLSARKPLPDVATPSGPMVVREAWSYTGRQGALIMGCVRYRNAQGWRTDLEMGDDPAAVARNLARQVRDNQDKVSQR